MIHPLITHHLSHNISSLSSLSSIISLTGGHNQSADAWALGVFFHELLVGTTPFVVQTDLTQRSESFRGGGKRNKSSLKRAADVDAHILSSVADVQVKGFHLSRAVSFALLDIDGCLDLLLGLLAAVPGSR